MNVLEIVAIVVLCILGMCTIYIWAQVVILIDKIRAHVETEKKPAPKNGADEEK